MTSKRKNTTTITTRWCFKRKNDAETESLPEKNIRVRQAILDINKKKSSIRKAARDNSVSVSFLRRRLSGEVRLDSRNGPDTVFSMEEEEDMAKWLNVMTQRGQPLRPKDILDFAQEIVVKERRKTVFADGRPSYKWYRKFMLRNKHIIKKISSNDPMLKAKERIKGNYEWYRSYRDFLGERALMDKLNGKDNSIETGESVSSEEEKEVSPASCNQREDGTLISPARSSESTPVFQVAGDHKKQQTKSKVKKVMQSTLKTYALRLKPGEDMVTKLGEFVVKKKLRAAFVLTCVGSVTKITLRMADSTTINTFEGPFEIVSLVGTLSSGGHLHGSFSDARGAVFGGHVMGDAIIYTTAEVVIGDCTHMTFTREHDPQTGYPELNITND